MRDGALVERVDLELEAVEAELAEQVALEEPRRLVGEPAAAEVGVDREPAEPHDPAALVDPGEAHHPGALVVELDHEAPDRLGLRQRALDLLADRALVGRARPAEEGLDVVVPREAGEEGGIVGHGSSDRDAHAGCGARRRNRTAPAPSATPPRISTSPASSGIVIGSPRDRAPETRAHGGRRDATSAAREGPWIASIR